MAKVDTTDWGTWKRIAQTQVVPSWDPTASPETYNATPTVPAGTKAVGGYYRFTCSVGTSAVSISETGGSNIVSQQFAQAANKPIAQTFEVQLDGSGTFDVIASSSNVTDVDVYVTKVAM